jgi:single-stranded-DNA-specific exonuclease
MHCAIHESAGSCGANADGRLCTCYEAAGSMGPGTNGRFRAIYESAGSGGSCTNGRFRAIYESAGSGGADADGRLCCSVYESVGVSDACIVSGSGSAEARLEHGASLFNSENSCAQCSESDSVLLISVDSGSNSSEAIEYANINGIDVVVLDHHIVMADLPKAVAVVNPNRKDQDDLPQFKMRNLCAVGVVFLFLIALQRELRNLGIFKDGEPDLRDVLDIVALGTVCDVMDLVGMNRAIVRYALSGRRCSAPIAFLKRYLKVSKLTNVEFFSFSVGPLINSAGRMDDPKIAMNLFLANDDGERLRVIEELQDLNKRRKHEEKSILVHAIEQASIRKLENNKAICVFGEGWHDGIIGIIAGRLKNKFKRPCFVISIGEDGIGKGSARSVKGISVIGILRKLQEEGLIIKGGGHELAAGFSVHSDKISDFESRIEDLLHEADVSSVLNIDCTLSSKVDVHEVLNSIHILEPFGKGNEEPVFCFMKLRLERFARTKDGNHIQLWFRGETGGVIRCILFGINYKADIAESIENHKDFLFDVAVRIKDSELYSYSMQIEDLRLSQHG